MGTMDASLFGDFLRIMEDTAEPSYQWVETLRYPVLSYFIGWGSIQWEQTWQRDLRTHGREYRLRLSSFCWAAECQARAGKGQIITLEHTPQTTPRQKQCWPTEELNCVAIEGWVSVGLSCKLESVTNSFVQKKKKIHLFLSPDPFSCCFTLPHTPSSTGPFHPVHHSQGKLSDELIPSNFHEEKNIAGFHGNKYSITCWSNFSWRVSYCL